MKTVLCYGDSNTWGADPRSDGRYPRDVRWTGVLRATLGADYEVIEEGCRGRTTVWPDPIEGDKDGKAYLPACLHTHDPIDLVIIMLGTNDLKQRFSLTAFDIAEGAGALADMVTKSGNGPGGCAPRVLLVAPAPVTHMTYFAEMFTGAEDKSRGLAAHFHRVAQERGCLFLDAGAVVRSSEADGIHLDPQSHAALGRALAEIVRAAP